MISQWPCGFKTFADETKCVEMSWLKPSCPSFFSEAFWPATHFLSSTPKPPTFFKGKQKSVCFIFSWFISRFRNCWGNKKSLSIFLSENGPTQTPSLWGFRSPSPRGWSWPRRNAKKTTMKFQIWRLSSRGLKSEGKGHSLLLEYLCFLFFPAVIPGKWVFFFERGRWSLSAPRNKTGAKIFVKITTLNVKNPSLWNPLNPTSKEEDEDGNRIEPDRQCKRVPSWCTNYSTLATSQADIATWLVGWG